MEVIKHKRQNLADVQKELYNKGEMVNGDVCDTYSETLLGEALLEAKIKVNPQYEVSTKSFDFKIKHFPILIEVDGSIHMTNHKRLSDYQKDRMAQKRGFCVLRFSNGEVENAINRVIFEIKDTMEHFNRQPREVILYPLSLWGQLQYFWYKIRGKEKSFLNRYK